MAITTRLDKVAIKMLLNNGTSADGTVKTVSVGLGTLNKDAYDAEKAIAIVDAIEPCLTKTVYSVQEVKTSSLLD